MDYHICNVGMGWDGGDGVLAMKILCSWVSTLDLKINVMDRGRDSPLDSTNKAITPENTYS